MGNSSNINKMLEKYEKKYNISPSKSYSLDKTNKYKKKKSSIPKKIIATLALAAAITLPASFFLNSEKTENEDIKPGIVNNVNESFDNVFTFKASAETTTETPNLDKPRTVEKVNTYQYMPRINNFPNTYDYAYYELNPRLDTQDKQHLIGQCVTYAHGRTIENWLNQLAEGVITETEYIRKMEILKYGFQQNAKDHYSYNLKLKNMSYEDWIDANINYSGQKLNDQLSFYGEYNHFEYGNEPELGAIAVYDSYYGYGHLAVVEDIKYDQNGNITLIGLSDSYKVGNINSTDPNSVRYDYHEYDNDPNSWNYVGRYYLNQSENLIGYLYPLRELTPSRQKTQSR